MIDNEKEVRDLIGALKTYLPMSAYATPPLAMAVRGEGGNIKVNDVVRIDSVLYMGDEGGIACAIGMQGKTAIVTSITHLRIDVTHPLAERIAAYQLRRYRKIEASPSRKSGESPASRAAERKRKKRGVAPIEASTKIDPTSRFQEARDLWKSGAYQLAAGAFREILRQESDDPTFSRYWLASCLFQMKATDELDELLRGRNDDTGVWRYAQALAAFRKQRDTEEAQRLLIEAHRLEPEFDGYLLRDKVVDTTRAIRFDGDPSERAFGCARLFLPAWRAAPGAATWARRVLKVPPSAANQVDEPRHFSQKELRSLPLNSETWQVGLLNRSDDGQSPMWLLAVANVDAQELRAFTVIDQPLTETVAWNRMIESFLSPTDGAPARPSTLVVDCQAFHDAWNPLLSRIGVNCRCESDPQPVGGILEGMSRVLDERELPPVEGIDIREFPQSDAVWQAAFIRSPSWIMNEKDGAYRPWTVLVLEKSQSVALATDNADADPSPELLLEYLVRTMARPGGESAERPRLVEVSDSDSYDYLRPRLEAAGVGCKLVDEMTEFDEFSLDLAKSYDGSEKCSLADGAGVTRAHMESYYEAANGYFKEAPWTRVPGERPIEIRCDDPAMGVRYAIVLGRSGVQLGLCVYDDWKMTRDMLSGRAAPEENRALAVCYDEAQIMSAVDLQLVERLGWPIATDEAWPAAIRLKPGHTPGSPNADELVYLDACLRAVPEFLKANATTFIRQVKTGTRQVELRLTWADLSRNRA